MRPAGEGLEHGEEEGRPARLPGRVAGRLLVAATLGPHGILGGPAVSTDPSGLEPPGGERGPKAAPAPSGPASSLEARSCRESGGRFVPLMVMHGPANSLCEAVNCGTAAVTALQAPGNAGLRSFAANQHHLLCRTCFIPTRHA